MELTLLVAENKCASLGVGLLFTKEELQFWMDVSLAWTILEFKVVVQNPFVKFVVGTGYLALSKIKISIVRSSGSNVFGSAQRWCQRFWQV